jgi:purine-binding chemotaxis protein CheW
MGSLENTSPDPVQLTDELHLVIFRLSQQNFALPISSIFQIIEMVTIIPVPKADPLIEGVINVRGKMVPVVNMRHLMNFKVLPFTQHTPIILVNLDGQMSGLVVDDVINVSNIHTSQISKPTDFLPDGLGSIPILQGMTNTPQGIVMLLDTQHLFDPGQGEALRQAVKALENTGESLIPDEKSTIEIPERITSGGDTFLTNSKSSKPVKKQPISSQIINPIPPGELNHDHPAH